MDFHLPLESAISSAIQSAQRPISNCAQHAESIRQAASPQSVSTTNDVRQLIVDDDGLLDFLSGMLTEVRSSAPPYISRKLRRETVRYFGDPDSITSRVEHVKNQGWGALSALRREAVEGFLAPEGQ